MPKLGVNDPCFCGSGRKYKKCHKQDDTKEPWFYIPPMISVAYKFFTERDEKYADDMVGKGSIQIGTLNYYRTIELRDSERSDPGEGRKSVYTDDKRKYSSTEELPPQHRQGITITAGTLDNSSGHKISVDQSIQDCYIYCVSEKMSPQNLSKYGPACVMISNPAAFYLEIDRSFRAYGSESLIRGGFRVRKCSYDNREQRYDMDQNVSACFLKPKEFCEDFEVRAVWQPTKLPIEKIQIPCSGIKSYCKRIS